MTPEERFLKRLRGLGARERAALRASAASPHTPDVTAHDAFTAAYYPIRTANLPRDACRLVAALYLWYPKDRAERDTDDDEDETATKGPNLAELLGRGVQKRKLGKEATERLVEQLLAAPFAGLPGLLLTAVQWLAKANVPIHWPRLIRDLAAWERPGGKGMTVQEQWADSWLQTGGNDAR